MKRGTTDLCLVLAVDKPSGMTSHDVVSRARRIFGEKRIGHTGTLDPLASGVLPLCVGPATRLDQFLTGHDKSYVVSVVFGAATDTDDCDGEVIRTGVVPDEVFDPFFASVFVGGLVGKSKQLPPVYSAIKVGGTKACDAARKGRVIDLAPRDIEVYSAELLGIGGADGTEPARWDIAFKVSKGTYIRALARDIGNSLGCPAHVGALRRTAAGAIGIADCVTLEVLEEMGERSALDPLKVLGVRLHLPRRCRRGTGAQRQPAGRARRWSCFERRSVDPAAELCACTAGRAPQLRAAAQWRGRGPCWPITSIVALYEYHVDKGALVRPPMRVSDRSFPWLQ